MVKKTLNIAELHWGFPPIIGGVETHLTLLLPELARRGHKVGLLTGSVEDEKTRYEYKGNKIFRSPLLDLNWLAQRGLEALEEVISKLYNEFFDAIKPDIIHAHNMHYFSEPHAYILNDMSTKKGVPLILTAHNAWDDMLFLKLSRQINWSHIIAVSHFIKKELMSTGYDEEKITVIHHGIDTKKFRPNVNPAKALKKYPKLKGKRIILHPARMGLAKGCDVSIKAFKLVKERFPNAVLVMGGSKNIIDWNMVQQRDIAYFLDLIKLFNLQDNTLIDVFSLEEMPMLYALADVTIYPSTSSEPFGLTMLESLAAGKPIIVTRMGGMPEVIQDDINGYVIPVKDFEALEERIISLLSSEKLRKRLGNTGKKMVHNQYTKEIMTNRHLEVFQDVYSANQKTT